MSNMTINLIYKGNNVCLSVWAVPGRFFQALPFPVCGDKQGKAGQGRADSNVFEEFLDMSDRQGRAGRANIFNYWPLSS